MTVLQQHEKARLQSEKFDVNKIAGIETIERELYNVLSDSEGVIREMCSHLLNAGGKRIRPLLVLYSGLLFSEETEQLVQAAVAAELIHMASLVHDDIIDNSSLRRSRPSINKMWGNHFAVLCGDYLFAKAFEVLSHNRLIESMDYMVRAIQNMCHGEILQADGRYDYNINIDTYYERILKKTALFLEYSCRSGAVLGGADESQLSKIGDYGLNLGLAFQIVDDILDFCGDVKVMGKPRGEDLRQGNITMPVLLLLENGKYEAWIKDIIDRREFSEQTIDSITYALRDSDLIDRVFGIAVSHIEKAKHCLSLLPDSQYSAFLYRFADMLQTRTN